jgi:MFS family permease
MASFSLAPFQSLLRLPGIPRLVVSSLVGRVPASMGPLSVVLLVQSVTGSYAHAGSAAGVFAIATAVASPLLGRLIDRVGQTRVLMSCGALFAAAFATLAVIAEPGVNMMLVLGCVALAGLANPPLAPSMRTLWSAKLDGPTLQTAYALESTMQEVIFITGPLLVALLVTTISPAAAVLAAAGLAFVGTVSFATSPASRAWRAQPRAQDWAGPLRDRGVRTLVAVMVLLAVAFGLLQVAIAAFAARNGAPGAAGVLLATWTFGSLMGGLVAGGRRWAAPVEHRYVGLLLLLAGVFALLLLPGTNLQMGLLIVFAGLPIAPWLACTYLLVDRLSPAGTVTEAFTWVLTGFLTGQSIGASLAGMLIDASGPRMACSPQPPALPSRRSLRSPAGRPLRAQNRSVSTTNAVEISGDRECVRRRGRLSPGSRTVRSRSSQ